MKWNKNRILMKIEFWRLIAADIAYGLSGEKSLIKSDLERILEELPYRKAGLGALNYALLYDKPYRNIFYYRIRKSLIARNISRLFLKPLDTIEIHGKIGRGFRISHNYAVIHPHSAGDNFSVAHGVTIGKGHPMKDRPAIVDPVIGDNVEIFANAVVFGGITIGDNVKIGAGAVVNKDIPSNSIVVGNPFRIIQKESEV